MKAIASQIAHLLHEPGSRTNLRLLGQFIGFAVVVIIVYTVIFHVLMWREGQEHSLLSGLYWTLVTMSTLGYGDITFEGDLGRMYSLLVLLSGVLILLVVLPFAFIQFFYAPWL